jgi:two-component system LytT family sensor kinase
MGSSAPSTHSTYAAHRTSRIADRVTVFGTIVLLATAFALVETAQQMTRDAIRGNPDTFTWIFGRMVLPWIIVSALAPFIVWLARAYPLGARRWRNWGIHALACVSFPMIHYWLLSIVHRLWIPGARPVWDSFGILMTEYTHWDIIEYCAIVGIVHSWSFAREANERRLLSETLRADLSQAQLAALRAQLHPHFLFNALNSVTMLVRRGDTDAATAALTRLSSLLRKVLRPANASEIALREEADFLREYLDIESVRFGKRLDACVEVPWDLEDALVPHMILQPLVENAMRHGVSRRSAPTKVAMRARCSDGMLELEVSDTGLGLGDAWQFETHAGVGLRNTKERLRALYGESAQLHVAHSGAESGVTVRVLLPLHRVRARDTQSAPLAAVSSARS